MCVRSIVFIFLVISLVLAQDSYTFGDREDGDQIIFEASQGTELTDEATEHTILFDWEGDNEVFSQVLVDVSNFQLISFGTPQYGEGDERQNREFILEVTDFEAHQLQANITVYGFPNRPIVSDFIRRRIMKYTKIRNE